MPQQLHMIWPNDRLATTPDLLVPEPYELRPAGPADAEAYVDLMHAAGFVNWDLKQFASWQQRALPNGIFVAVERISGGLAATAMGSHRATDRHPAGGELGWVAGDPEHAGHGLGQTVCTAALRRFLDAGYERIYLMTDDWRLAAIKTYLKLGFVPFLYADGMDKRWANVHQELGWPQDRSTWTKAPADQWIIAEDVRPNLDREERYHRRHKWLPNRIHRGYSGNGDVDAFGDESLYHPSQLGTASCAPAQVQASQTAGLELSYTVGAVDIRTGTTVTFVIRGQSPLGHATPMPTVSGPAGCRFEPSRHGFKLTQGTLNTGDQVRLQYAPFAWTPLAGRREFKPVIAFPDGSPEQRLPEPVTVDVLPGPAAVLEATAPCTRRPGTTVNVHVACRDASDNRAPCTDPVDVGSHEGLLRDGVADIQATPDDAEVVRVDVAVPSKRLQCRSNPCITSDGRQLYVGDLHCHDFMSEAEGYPDAVYRWAIQDRRLDFVSVVPQSHGWHDNETWTLTKYMNERYLREGEFVTLLGFEWQQAGYGDKVVHYLGGDQPVLPVDDARYNSAAKLYAALRNSDALVISHHPAYPKGSWCSNTDFDVVETDVERLVEIWSMHGSSEGYDPKDRPFAEVEPDSLATAALKRGVRLGFTGGSDTHSARPGGSCKEPRPHWGGLTAVWADSLTRRDIFAALHQRRTYALTRARIVLRMTVNDAPMGSELAFADRANIHLDVWAPDRIAKVEVLRNADLFHTEQPNVDEFHFDLEDPLDTPAFYHCRVTLADANLAVCSPVWIG